MLHMGVVSFWVLAVLVDMVPAAASDTISKILQFP
jgi:hypothetical protein